MCTEVDWKEEFADLHENTGYVTVYGPQSVGLVNLSEDFAHSDIATAACKAIIVGNTSVSVDQIKKTPYTEDDDVTFHTFTTDFNYQVYGIENKSTDTAYEENATFTTFDGMTMIAPHEGNTFSVKVEAGEFCLVLMKEGNGVTTNKTYVNGMVLPPGEDALLRQCIKKGKKEKLFIDHIDRFTL